VVSRTLVAALAGLIASAALAVAQDAPAPVKKDAPAPAKEAAAPAAPKKKDRCTDGEPAEVAKFTVSKGEVLEKAINEPLASTAGDPEKGLHWMVHRRLGNCLACHKISSVLKRAEKTPSIDIKTPNGKSSSMPLGTHGEVGPSLDGVATRYSEGELRLLVVDPKQIFPDTIMPAFHKKDGFTRVHPDCQGHAILSAEQVEDVVAFLKTLK